MRYLTEQERRLIESERDMLKGNINRMCVTDDIKELYKQADFARHRITKIENIAKSRFADHTGEVKKVKESEKITDAMESIEMLECVRKSIDRDLNTGGITIIRNVPPESLDFVITHAINSIRRYMG